MTVPRIDMDGPEADATGPDGLMRYRGELFTGEMVEQYDDGRIFSRTTYVNGMEDGPSQGFYADGSPQSAGVAARNKAVGEWREWHPDGSIRQIDVYDDTGRLRARRKWDAAGTLIQEVTQ
ncbi:toxin-antitoxin system YwqK family antitoxin [Streptomyces sp. NPDC002666]